MQDPAEQIRDRNGDRGEGAQGSKRVESLVAGWARMSTDETHGAPKMLVFAEGKAGEANPRMPEGCGNKIVLGAAAEWRRVF
jgi:hypothetical protein